MRSLRAALERAVADRGGGVIAYLTLGDPDRAGCRRAAFELASAGCVALELGLPTPSAQETPPIARAHALAASQLSGDAALALAAELAAELPCPVMLLAYWTALGDDAELERFLHDAAAAEVSSTLVVGLPLVSVARYHSLSVDRGLETVLTVAAEMPAPLRQRIYRATTGGIYMVASGDVAGGVEQLKRETSLPVIVGGGISELTAVAAVHRAGASAVLGSAVAERIARGLPLAAWIEELQRS